MSWLGKILRKSEPARESAPARVSTRQSVASNTLPSCSLCGIRLTIVPSQIDTLYGGVVCTACSRVICLDCLKKRDVVAGAPCPECKGQVMPARPDTIPTRIQTNSAAVTGTGTPAKGVEPDARPKQSPGQAPVSPHPTSQRITLEQKLTAASLSPSEQPPSGAGGEHAPHLPSSGDLAVIYAAVDNMSLSSDGTLLLTRRHFDQSLFLLDLRTNSVRTTFKSESTGWFELIPDGAGVAVVAKDKRSVLLYDVDGRQTINQTGKVKGDIRRFALSPDGSHIAIGFVGGLQVWNWAEHAVGMEIALGLDKQCYLAWSPNSAALAMGFGQEGRVWRRDGLQEYRWEGYTKNNYKYPVMAVGFVTDNSLIAGDNFGTLRLIDVRNQSSEYLSEVEGAPVFAVATNPGHSLVAIGRGDSTLEVWEPGSGRVAALKAHGDAVGASKWVESVQWFSDGRRICTYGGGDIRIWNLS